MAESSVGQQLPHSERGSDEGSLPPFLEFVSCPVCGDREFCLLRSSTYPADITRRQLLEVYRSSSDQVLMDQLVQCRGCGLPYLNPRVKAEVVMESYLSAVDPRFAEQNPERAATFRRVLERWMRRLRFGSAAGKRVLDVGCAGGAFPKVVLDLGFSVVGVEPSRWLCEFGQKQYGLDLRPGTLEAQHLQSEEFDLVTFWDVIEHLVDPEQTMREAHRLLKKGGYLIVNYPDYSSLPRKVLRYRWPFFLSVHLFYFSPRTIRLFLGKCGFHTVEIRPYFQTLRLGYVLERATVYFGAFRLIKRLADRLHLGELRVRYYIGQTMVTARKL